MRFSIEPLPGDSGFSQWHSAMKMVSQLPEGIPPEFRRRLWLSLADKHLSAKNIDWTKVEKNCFSEWSHPSDAELGVQIVKDLHRTGCSLFCGKDGQENQALLKRVLLAYARWNKAVGYCQGFNMLAALILQVTEKSESDALKLMIYLIEGVLPESYFADSLRGLSVDMVVFRELLRTKLPRLSKHLDTLQVASKEGTTSYEPPLTNVFTMQWFLTLFCNCLPQPTVLRVWDLILLEGNEILLRTSLAIWQVLADRIMEAKSADEFYCVMGVLMREILEYDLIDANTLIKGIVGIGPLTELRQLREHYLYNINPLGIALPSSQHADKRVKLYHKDRLLLDIGVLKKQYTKLKQRQRQAHIIFNTAVARQASRASPVAMNHLLLGKSALVPAKRLGPPKGAIPPARQVVQQPRTIHWKDAPRQSSSSSESSSSSSSDTELCDDPECQASDEEEVAAVTTLSSPPAAVNNDDNLTILSQTNSASVVDNYDDNQTLQSDIFDTEAKSDLYDLNNINIERSNSLPSEDGFDFEKFLEERVRSFKETKSFSSEESLEENSEQERIKHTRKNSVRALEIIQENSIILHRILQCQSRLTPSPPPIEFDDAPPNTTDAEPDSTDDIVLEATNHEDDAVDINLIEGSCTVEDEEVDDLIKKYNLGCDLLTPTNEDVVVDEPPKSTTPSETDYYLEKYRKKLGSPIEETAAKPPELIEIDKNSKYNSIIEYSRNLDEKFNNLILNSSPKVHDRLRYNYSLDSGDDFTPLSTLTPKKSTSLESIIDISSFPTIRESPTLKEFSYSYSLLNDNQNDFTFSTSIESNADAANKPATTLLVDVSPTTFFKATLDAYRQRKVDETAALMNSDRSPTISDKSPTNNSLYKYNFTPENDESVTVSAIPVQSNIDNRLYSPTSSSNNLTLDLDCEVTTTMASSDAASLSPNSSSTLEAYRSRKSYNVDSLSESPSLKSPNRIYNPFPINISSRQNKEVAVRLGLYKK